MKKAFLALAALGVLFVCPGPGQAGKPKKATLKTAKEAKPMSFELSSPAFKPNALIPVKHSCSGEDVSPQLKWSEPPKGTQSFALVMDDPDTPAGTWVHWVVYDIPLTSQGLAESLPKKEALKDGTKQGLAYGVREFSRLGYGGPCPPSGTHHYVFKLFALDKVLNLKPKATVFELSKAMEGHILAKAELIGTFKK